MDEKNGEEIKYNWVKGNLIIHEQHINILCEQYVQGDADQGRDNDDGDDDEGVERTNMVDEVFEDESLMMINKAYEKTFVEPLNST